jgi:hypothetical protein
MYNYSIASCSALLLLDRPAAGAPSAMVSGSVGAVGLAMVGVSARATAICAAGGDGSSYMESNSWFVSRSAGTVGLAMVGVLARATDICAAGGDGSSQIVSSHWRECGHGEYEPTGDA